MLPDSIPSPKTAEPLEAHLRQFDLPEVPAALEARMQALFAAPPVAARMPERNFWRKELPWVAAVSGVAACAVIVVQLQTGHTTPPAAPTTIARVVATPTPDPTAEAVPPAALQAQLPVFEGAVPVGYQYQGSRALYVEEVPVGTLHSDTPQRAYQRRTLLRHTFQNPQTQATYEVDAPREDVVLEDLQSF